MSTAFVEQIYTGCLAQAAYFVCSEGEAAVIDPLRDPAPYLEMAKKHNAKIKYVIETHFHADFVSGHQDLARASGATIVFGPSAQPNFEAFIAKDGEDLKLGKHTITVLHTPGHTTESATFLLRKDDGTPHCIFTGDTLFIGDAGRPDLAQKAASMTKEQLASLLYKSLREKIMPLPDDVIVYPAHGAGSACGKNMSSETFDTLGKQKLTNYTLRADATEEEFVKELLDGLGSPPGYFGTDVAMNKGEIGADVHFSDILNGGLQKKLSPAEVKTKMDEGIVAFDTRRTPKEFMDGHVPNSVFAGTSGNLAVWVATVFPDVTQPYIVIADDETLVEGISRLARVGFNNCIGHLDGGLKAWSAAGYDLATIKSVDAKDVAELMQKEPSDVQLIDVRGPGEFQNSHIDCATSAPLCSREPIDFKGLVKAKHAFAHCAGGYRSVMHISLARRAGVTGLANITGGYQEMMKVPELKQKEVTRN